MDRIVGEEFMRRLWSVVGLFGILVLGSGLGADRLSDFEVKALDVMEKTRPAVESAAFKDLQRMFREKRIALRFLTKGAYTAKFVNAKDKKEYLITAVPMVSHFPEAAPPLPALIVSDGEEFRSGWLQAAKNARGKMVCALQGTDGKLVAHAKLIETLKESPLPVPRGEAAIAIAKNPEKDDVILILCRSPYAAKTEEEMEYSAVIFYSGDFRWGNFAVPGAAEAK